MTLGERLAAAMAARRCNGKRLAEQAAISEGYLSQLLHGEREHPSAAVLARLAAALGVSADYLAGELTAGEQCDRCGAQLQRGGPSGGRRWWCAPCRQYRVPLGYRDVEALLRDDLRRQRSMSQPGHGKSGGRRKRRQRPRRRRQDLPMGTPD
jgi:transcriptional regulator with XRE-family HTH domain